MCDYKVHCYKDDILIANQKINDSIDSNIGYIFVSDLHNGAYLICDENGHLADYESDELTAFKQDCRLAELEAIAEIAKNNDKIDFICVGGDTINGYETCEGAREKAASLLTCMLNPLLKSGKMIFLLMGNHDDGSFHRVYYPWWRQVHKDIVFSDKYWNDKFLTPYIPQNCVHDSTYKYSKYYYYDLVKNGKCTRIVCLDNFDARMPFDENGNVTEWIKENVEYGYSKHQLKWLVNEAIPCDFDGDIIILSHMGIDEETNNSHTPGGDKLRKVISAFQNKLQYIDDLGVTADYTNNNGKLLVYHFGHIHKNIAHYSDDIKLWQISNDASAEVPSFDVMLISNENIQRIHIGEDVDNLFDITKV